MREPISTVTNAAYPAFAFAAIYVTGWGVGASAFLITSAALGIASAGYHATLEKPWQLADEIAMYGAFGVMAIIGAGSMGLPEAAIWVLVAMSLLLIVFAGAADSHVWVPVLVVINLIMVFVMSGFIIFAATLLAYLTMVVIRANGERGKAAGDHLLHDVSHGMWHIGTAAANAFVYMSHVGEFA